MAETKRKNKINEEAEEKEKGLAGIFDIPYLKAVFLSCFFVVLTVLLFYYLFWHLTDGFSAEILLATAEKAEASETLDGKGYIFRKEAVISSAYEGAIVYSASNGDKVGAAQQLARVYQDTSNTYITERLKKIEERKAILTASRVGDNTTLSDLKAADKEISASLSLLMGSISRGKLIAASAYKDELIIPLNKKLLIANKKTGFDSELDALLYEEKSLLASLSGQSEAIYADRSCYFYSYSDGYEDIFTLSALESITPSSFRALKEREKAAPSGQVVGKTVSEGKWYIAMETAVEETTALKDGEEYTLLFRDKGSLSLTMTLERVVREEKDALLIFSSTKMPQNFFYTRSGNISVVTKKVTGYKVPLSSLRSIDGISGVYVRYGNTIFFRTANVAAIADGYAYLDINTPPATYIDEMGEEKILYKPIGNLDQVVISGKELFHGKITD